MIKVDLWGETSDKIKANAKCETSANALTNVCLQLSKRLDPKYLLMEDRALTSKIEIEIIFII